METCPKCGREQGDLSCMPPSVHGESIRWCFAYWPPEGIEGIRVVDNLCEALSSAFARGRAAGMREAREIAEAWVSSTHNADDWDSETTYDWSDVDREIARRLGNA